MVRNKPKLILSRKGFDSSSGGFPSIIWGNKLFSIPIPEAGSGIFYKDLLIDEKYSYLDLMRDLNIRFYSEAHLDPDLRKECLIKREQGWKPIFGQHKNAQTVLSNKFKIEEGDIFLFFGSFQRVKENGIFRYTETAPKHKKDVHLLFGYMEIAEIMPVKSGKFQHWMDYHPHIKNQSYYSENNTIYISSDAFSYDSLVKGAGYLNFSEDLILTAPNQTKSTWELPECFDEKDIKEFTIGTRYQKKPVNNKYTVTLIGRGLQEIFCTTNEDILNWAKKIIRDHAE